MIALLAALLLQAQSTAPEGKVKWTRDYDQGLQLAKKAEKPVLLYFSC